MAQDYIDWFAERARRHEATPQVRPPRKATPRPVAIATVVALVVAVVLSLVLPTPARADSLGYWRVYKFQSEGGKAETVYHWWSVGANGQWDKGGGDDRDLSLDSSASDYVEPRKSWLNLSGQQQNVPDAAPDGWSLAIDHVDTSTTTTELVDNADTGDLDGKKISETDVTWDFTNPARSVSYVAMKVIWQSQRSFVSWIMDGATGFLSLIDRVAVPTYETDWGRDSSQDGSGTRIYDLAKAVSDRIAIPFGTAFLGVTLGVVMVRKADERRRARATDWSHGMLSIILGFAVSWALITHGIDLCGAVYWVGQQAVRGVQVVFASQGLGTSVSAAVGSGLKDAYLEGLDALTYGDGGAAIGFALFAIVAWCVCVGCTVYVLTTAFLRMGEVYLRAALSPIAMAFFMGEPTRPLFWNYVKRFGAVCLEAAIIILALGMAGLISSVFTDAMSLLMSQDASFGGVVVATVPPLVAVCGVTALVRRASAISAAVFELAG